MLTFLMAFAQCTVVASYTVLDAKLSATEDTEPSSVEKACFVLPVARS